MTYLLESVQYSLHPEPETQSRESPPSLPFPENKMVSPKLAIITALALVTFLSTNETDGASYYPSELHADSAEVASIASQKVNLSVYYTSLCQPCATFIVQNLEGIFNNDLINIINLQLVPWANAYVNKTNNSIICQVLFYPYYLCYA